jgi:hypothetical protein
VLWFYRVRHKFADGYDDWEYKAIGEEPTPEVLREMGLLYESDFSDFDTYRGVDTEPVTARDLPPMWISNEIDRTRRRADSCLKYIMELEVVVDQLLEV